MLGTILKKITMDGTTLLFSIAGIVIGAIVSYFVSKHFFKKGVKKKSLTPYIQFSSKLFSDLDHELREDLIVNYKNLNVENLAQAQFIVANSGDIAIRDIIKPLRLTLPLENKIFNISIIHIEPEGREIKYNVIETEKSNIIEFNIPLLNAGEYFVFKILTQDVLPKEENDDDNDEDIDDLDAETKTYKFTITADDLPPKLTIRELPYSYYEHEKLTSYDWMSFWIGLISLIVFIATAGTLYSLKFKSENLYLFNPRNFFNLETFSFYNVSILLLALFGTITLLMTILGFIMALSEISPREEPKFKVPDKLRKDKRFSPFEILR